MTSQEAPGQPQFLQPIAEADGQGGQECHGVGVGSAWSPEPAWPQKSFRGKVLPPPDLLVSLQLPSCPEWLGNGEWGRGGEQSRMPRGLPHPPWHGTASLVQQEGELALWDRMFPGSPNQEDGTCPELSACGHLDSRPCRPSRSFSMAPKARCTTPSKWGLWAQPSAQTC